MHPTTTNARAATSLVIEFRSASKTYTSLLGRKTVRAVEEFSLHVAEGEVLGIAGPNGAGKSTLISLLLGYIAPSGGDVLIRGLAPRAYVEANGIGYLSELVAIHPRWKAHEALARFAILAGVPQDEVSLRVDGVIARLGLEEHRSKKIKALSKGTLQRIGLGQALLREERILILDEPTHGLDPVWTQRFRDVVKELRRPDRTILIASHNLDELQRVADRVAIIDHGRLQRVVSTGFNAAESSAGTYRIAVAAGAAGVPALLPAAMRVGDGEFEVAFADVAELNATLARLISNGVMLASVVPARSVLEQQFREAVGELQ